MKKILKHCPHCGSNLRAEGAAVCADCGRQTSKLKHVLGSSLLIAVLTPIALGVLIWSCQQASRLYTQALGEPHLEILSASSDGSIILKNGGDTPILVQFCRFDLPKDRSRVFFDINQLIQPGDYVTHQLEHDLQIQNDVVSAAASWSLGNQVVATASSDEERKRIIEGMISAEPEYLDWWQVFYTHANPELKCYESYLGDSLVKVPATITVEFRDLNKNEVHSLSQPCSAILTSPGEQSNVASTHLSP